MSYVVSSKFADVINGGPVGSWIGRSKSIRFGDGIPRPVDLEAAARDYMQSYGLELQAKKAGGRNMITEDGATIERRVVYALTNISDVYDAAQAMIGHVAAEHGPGRVWLTAPLSYLHRRDAEPGFVETRIQGTDNSDRDEPYSFTPTGDGTRKILLGMYYFHEATGPRPTAINEELERSLTDLNKHEHDTSSLEQLHAIQKQVAEDIGSTGLASDPWSELDAYYRAGAAAGRASRAVAKLTKAPSEPGRQYVQPVNPFPPLWSYDSKSPVLDGGVWLRSRPGEKHGPNETGASGPRDVDCKKCAHERIVAREAASKDGTFTVSKEQMYRSRIEHQTVMPDPLDEVIDGEVLRNLVARDETNQRHDLPRYWTPAQRAAVSAHWSAQLRAKVEASRAAAAESEPSVRYCEVEPWE